MTSLTLSSDSFYDHKFHNLVPRALSPGFGGAAGTRPTSKARKKRPGDEVANFINFCPGITRFLQATRMITILNLKFFFSVGALLGIIFGGVALLVVILLVCCCWSKCPLAKWRGRRRNGQMAVVHYPRAGIVQTTLPPYPRAGMQTTTHPYPGAGIQTASQPYPAGAGVQTTIQPYAGAGPQAISPPYPVTGQTQNAGPPYPGTGVQVQDGNQVYGKN